jgi:hypothetical protein
MQVTVKIKETRVTHNYVTIDIPEMPADRVNTYVSTCYEALGADLVSFEGEDFEHDPKKTDIIDVQSSIIYASVDNATPKQGDADATQ